MNLHHRIAEVNECLNIFLNNREENLPSVYIVIIISMKENKKTKLGTSSLNCFGESFE